MVKEIPESSVNIIPILNQFKERTERVYGKKLKRIILYGSYARGMASKDSDIDLMIVLSEMESAFSEIERLTEIKFDISLNYDVVISTNPVSEESFLKSGTPYFKNVAKDGIAI